jgi:integrase
MLRVTINKNSTSLSIKRSIKRELWNAEAGLAKGKNSEVESLNKYIDAIRAKAYEKYTELMTKHEFVTPDLLKDAILGINTAETKMLLEVWQDHNNRIKKLVGKEISYTLWQKYNACRSFFEVFLDKCFDKRDIALKMVDRDMVLKFELFLKTERNCSYNTTIKYLQQFRKIMRMSLLNGWIKHDPFFNVKLSLKDVDRPYLDERELRLIVEKPISNQRLSIVRDIFVFSCFTGLSYSDIKKLNESELEKDNKGTIWIHSKRKKTGVRANIPLLEIPLKILAKYRPNSEVNKHLTLLPVASNQKVNAYLKEIADICGVNKPLTFHSARHTFATTVTLTHGVPIETVSKMLGHKNIKQTQHYARIVDLKVGEDMLVLSKKLGSSFQLNGLPG